jgi:hypothetical protein
MKSKRKTKTTLVLKGRKEKKIRMNLILISRKNRQNLKEEPLRPKKRR